MGADPRALSGLPLRPPHTVTPRRAERPDPTARADGSGRCQVPALDALTLHSAHDLVRSSVIHRPVLGDGSSQDFESSRARSDQSHEHRHTAQVWPRHRPSHLERRRWRGRQHERRSDRHSRHSNSPQARTASAREGIEPFRRTAKPAFNGRGTRTRFRADS